MDTETNVKTMDDGFDNDVDDGIDDDD